uniref:50S ribosomal protein L20 n=1 Tax=Nitzschia sp. (in: diatoms) TaxID=1884248 RepID=A0A5J6DUN6_9STRA|nr:ribosomal protein L20 [Nitzschia sp. (in: diatoms)]QES95320.1 ribosomal protein L20 [Nitzschia sp. (in: diatoms)]
MIRVKRGTIKKRKHKKILLLAKGYRGAHSSLFKIAKQQVLKGLKRSYIDRKLKKRFFRKIWIIRLNAIAKFYNLNYNTFLFNLKTMNIRLNRKILSQISIYDFITIKTILQRVKGIEPL